MRLSYKGIWWIGLGCSLALIGCPAPKASEEPSGRSQPTHESAAEETVAEVERPDGVIGFYELDDPGFYGFKTMSEVPDGQVMRLGIEEDRWMMRNMLTGYGGTVEQDGTTLVVRQGPTGAAGGTEKLNVARTEYGVDVTSADAPTMVMKMRFVADSAPGSFGYEELLVKP